MCCPERAGSSVGLSLSGFGRCGTGPEAKAVIAGFEDVAVVVRRSSKAVVILASPKMLAHSLKLRLVVITTLSALVELAEQMEQQAPPDGLKGR
jgi:hypothetical protein